MRGRSAVVLVACMLLAGCTDGGAGDASGEVPEELATGYLRGLVVDATIRPIEGAVVTILQNGTPVTTVNTDANGEFGVGGLAPGDHRVNASKPGFIAREVNATVVAGVATPEPIQVVLTPLPVDTSFVWPHVWEGTVGCGATPQNWCAGVNLVTGINVFNDQSFEFLFDDFMAYQRTPDFMQVEFVWEPNMELSSYAFAAFWASTWERWEECLCTDNLFTTEGGSTHILAQANRTVFEELDVGFSRGVGVGFSVGTGEGENLQDPDTYSVMYNQPFEGFFHVFYGCLPPEGWMFTTHGDPECDPKTLEAA